MSRHPRGFLGLAAALALAGCASTPPPAQVTRFHLEQPVTPGPISVQALHSTPGATLEDRAYVHAVAAELQKLGFSPAQSNAPAPLAATVEVIRNIEHSVRPPRSSMSIGVGGGSYGSGVGIGIGTSFGIGKRRSNDIANTQLRVQIKRSSDDAVVWEGRATSRTAADSPPADDVTRLAAALFKDFPGPSGKTVEVR